MRKTFKGFIIYIVHQDGGGLHRVRRVPKHFPSCFFNTWSSKILAFYHQKHDWNQSQHDSYWWQTMKTGSPGFTAHGWVRKSSGILDREFIFLPFVLGTKSTRGGRGRPFRCHPVAVLSCLGRYLWTTLFEIWSWKISVWSSCSVRPARLCLWSLRHPSDSPRAELWSDLCFCKTVVCQLVTVRLFASLPWFSSFYTPALYPDSCHCLPPDCLMKPFTKWQQIIVN